MRLSGPACPVVSALRRKEDSTHRQPDGENREVCHRAVGPPKSGMFAVAEGTSSHLQRSNHCKYPEGRFGKAPAQGRCRHGSFYENHSPVPSSTGTAMMPSVPRESADHRRHPPGQLAAGSEMPAATDSAPIRLIACRTVIGKRSTMASAEKSPTKDVDIKLTKNAPARNTER
jgi:hypothetical protein